MIDQLRLHPAQRRTLIQHTEDALPYEAVGLFIGLPRAASEWWTPVNLVNDAPTAEARKRCEVSEEQLTPLLAAWREVGLEIKAWWHSHPSTPAHPSELDKVLTQIPLQVIVTGRDTFPSQKIRAWWVDGTVREVKVTR